MFDGFTVADIETSGAKSHTGTVYGDVLSIWKQYGEEVIGGPIDCGHYVNEEAPVETYEWFMKFFAT